MLKQKIVNNFSRVPSDVSRNNFLEKSRNFLQGCTSLRIKVLTTSISIEQTFLSTGPSILSKAHYYVRVSTQFNSIEQV